MILKNWSWSAFFDALPAIFAGMWTTLGLTLAAFVVALVVGMMWTLILRIRFRWFTMAVRLVMNFIRTTPPLVQLYFLFFAWPLVPYFGLRLDALAVGIIGLGIHFSTYISETYRSGIEAIPKGQWEASRALNFNTFQTWTRVILPQAIPPVIPMLGNYLIIMFKEVPLTSAIGVAGMLLVAREYGAQYYTFVEPLTLVGLFFLLLSYPSSLLVQRLENVMNRRFEHAGHNVSTEGKEVTAS